MKNTNAIHAYDTVPDVKLERSVFSRSHGHKTAFDSGYLVPVYVDEVLPGDSYNVRMTSFARLSTPIVPIMDNMYLDVFFFYVPNRLLWSNWQKFCGEQVNPGDSIDYLVPEITAPTAGYSVGSIYDYMGIPTGINQIKHSALFLRAYNLIYNEWFRDENLQNSVTVPLGDTGEAYTTYTLLRRGKRHDYFTSCLPWPQKGAAVGISLSGTAPLVYTGSTGTNWSNYIGTGNNVFLRTQNNANLYLHTDQGAQSYWGGFENRPETGLLASASTLSGSGSLTAGQQLYVPNSVSGTVSSFLSNHGANLASATAVTINSLRQSFQIQRLLERDARGGSRYVEILRSHFGVTSPDYRLQRPEYLGGGSYPISVNPIAQTSSTVSGSPLANLSGVGLFAGSSGGFNKSFTEHGIILGIASVRADISYQQGLNRMWSRRTRYDFYWPALSHIGEQSVLNKEIYSQGPTVLDNGVIVDDKVFGYQERYSEYRSYPSLITGKFRSSASGTLHIWHLAQQFSALPVLNASFIEDNPPVSRVQAVTSEPQILFDSFFSVRVARAMPVFGVPGLMDHF